MWVVLLPFIDQKRLLDVLQPLHLQCSAEEQARNRAGEELLFFHKNHNLRHQVDPAFGRCGGEIPPPSPTMAFIREVTGRFRESRSQGLNESQ